MTAAIVSSLIFAAALVGALLLARRWQARIAAVSLVVLAALLVVPRLFVVDGVFLREASSMSASRLVLVAGMDVGAVGVAFLAFLLVGFVMPLASAALAAQRREKDARESLWAHLAIVGVAILLSALPFTPMARDAQFALFRGQRDDVVRSIASGQVELAQDRGRADVRRMAPKPVFPRLACCGNVVYVLDGERVLFPMARFGRRSWGYLHGPTDTAFRELKSYGDDWRLVAIDWTPEG